MMLRDNDRVALVIAGWLALFVIAMAMSSCGTATDRQTRTVEKVQTTTGPLIIDTPVGQFVAQPVRHEMVRSEHEVSTEQVRIDAPEVGQLIQAAAGGTPFGAIAGIVGLVGAAGAGWKAIQNSKRASQAERMRDEVIDGIERGSEDMPDEHWEKMRAALEAEQSADTKRAVKARVG